MIFYVNVCYCCISHLDCLGFFRWVPPGLKKILGETLEAVLKMDSTMPDSSDELIMSTMRGNGASREDFTRVVGMGSKEQVEAFAWETNFATEMESIGEKEEREHWGRQTAGGSVVRVW